MNKIFLILLLSCLAPFSASAIEVAFEKDSSLPLVYLNVAVKGGAIDDSTGQSGISNFMGEMLLRGTQSRTKEQIDLELDQMGARLEVEVRAEGLILRGAVQASLLDPFLRLMKEIVTEPAFLEHEIRKVKAETISKISEELGQDSSLASRWATRFMFQGHPYGNPILGKESDIKNLTRAKIMAQYDRLFREKRLLVIGAGDADENKIKAWAKSLARVGPHGEEPFLVPGPKDGEVRHLLIVDKPDRTQTQIYGGQVGVRMTDPRFFPLYLANHAFGGGSFSARMMVEIRVKRGWSYGAYSYFRHGRRPRSWVFHLFPAAKDTPQALEYTLQMIEDFRQKGMTPVEFDFAKRSLVNSAGFMYNTPQKRVENLLLERTLDLPDGFMKIYGAELEKVTLEQTNQAIFNFLKPDRMSITVLGTAADLKDSLAKSVGLKPEQAQVVPYTQE